jgi:hypothetical protein
MIKEWDFLVKMSYHERQGIQKMLETNTKVNKPNWTLRWAVLPQHCVVIINDALTTSRQQVSIGETSQQFPALEHLLHPLRGMHGSRSSFSSSASRNA